MGYPVRNRETIGPTVTPLIIVEVKASIERAERDSKTVSRELGKTMDDGHDMIFYDMIW